MKAAFGFKSAERACRFAAGQPAASLPRFPPLPLPAEQREDDAGDTQGCPELGKHTGDPPQNSQVLEGYFENKTGPCFL